MPSKFCYLSVVSLKFAFPFGMFPVLGQDGLPVEPSAGMGPQQPEARTRFKKFFFAADPCFMTEWEVHRWRNRRVIHA